ncbi:hypothetical protein BDFB_004506 [Asbolus verrucosus]|uniref:Uncharacterized protein n=1 Tax=Asbolus verrucosus TaxID=1661398 RepID=A0A482VBP2_ASBVE|nr:hypothetical protein BDFB_004506 [Asbolus verrucosus]
MLHLGLFLTVLFVAVQNGWALRCWSCSSDLDPSCRDYFNATKLQQQRSYFQQVNYNNQYQGGNTMPMLTDCSNNLGQVFGQKQVCVKEIINQPYGKTSISRHCQSVSNQQEVGTCPNMGRDREFCEYCDSDGCNAAAGLKANVLAAMAVPCVLLFFLSR